MNEPEKVLRIETVMLPDESVAIAYTVYHHRVEFMAKEIVARADPGGAPCYEYFTEGGIQEFTEDFDKGDRFVAGTVKWDGCSNVDFGDGNGYLHFCGIDHAARVGEVLAAAYHYAAEHVPSFDRALAHMSPAAPR